MDFATDLPLFYADFGTDAIVNGDASHPVAGLFDANFADALGMVSGVRPVFRAAQTSPIVRGADITIKGVAYKTKAGEPIGNDEILWPLEKV